MNERPAGSPPPVTVVLVAAMARNRVIGRDNALPWRLGPDLRRFRALTMGRPVVMGRRTHASIGRPLPGRDNLVVTRDRGYAAPGCRVFHDLGSAIDTCDGGVAMVIGGAQIYAAALPLATSMHLTLIDADIEGDVRFPEFDRAQWVVVAEQRHPPGPDADHPYRFVDYRRVDGPASRGSVFSG